MRMSCARIGPRDKSVDHVVFDFSHELTAGSVNQASVSKALGTQTKPGHLHSHQGIISVTEVVRLAPQAATVRLRPNP